MKIFLASLLLVVIAAALNNYLAKAQQATGCSSYNLQPQQAELSLGEIK